MNNVYKVTVVGRRLLPATGVKKDVEIRVANVNEDGVVTLSAVQARIGVPLTASLTDPDGGVTNVTWQWL